VSVTTRPNLRAARHRDRRGFAARMDRSSRQLQSRPQRRLPLPTHQRTSRISAALVIRNVLRPTVLATRPLATTSAGAS